MIILGEGIVTIINLFNPSRIILGGKIVHASNLIKNSILSIVQRRALELPRRNTEIVFSEISNHAGALGSTIPIIEHFFRERVNDWISEK